MLDEHQVGLLAGFRAPFAEAAGVFDVGAAVVLREGRIGQHAVELANLAVLGNERVFQRIPVFDGEAGDVVEDHVHVADRPDGAVGVLPVERQVVGVLALFFHVLMRLNQKAAGADRGVVHCLPGGGLGNLHQQAYYLGGGVELAAFLAGAVGEILDEVFIGCTQQVRELESVVDERPEGVEVVEQVLPLLIADLGLALDLVEVDVVLEYAGERVVFVLEPGDGLVEHGADVVLEVLEGGHLRAVVVPPGFVPACPHGHIESFAVGGLVFQQLGQEFELVVQMGKVVGA